MMFAKKKADWKECLAPEDQELLCKILETTKKHRCAYSHADDIKIAQIWCALLEFRKEFDALKESCEKTQIPFKAIAEIGEVEKRKTIDRIIREIAKPEPDQEEAIQKLVNSLMKL